MTGIYYPWLFVLLFPRSRDQYTNPFPDFDSAVAHIPFSALNCELYKTYHSDVIPAPNIVPDFLSMLLICSYDFTTWLLQHIMSCQLVLLGAV